MATRKPKENDVSLPFAALQLLAPPVRLVSAALWKVMKKRDVMQYGIVEEFVTSACDTVPGLLTTRHQGKLTVGLRARLILELCSKQPDVEVIKSHLERIRVPPSSSGSTGKKDLKILRTVEHFNYFVYKLLTDPAQRKQFYQEEFPVEYGPKFDQELEKLLWEFLIRLDQLLPVPNLAQTVSWLTDAPAVLEECAQAATQPQLLEILLQHQTCLGHLESAASLPPNMGDSILASLSLPPSGRVTSNQLSGGGEASAGPSGVKKGLSTPVFGLLSNEDVPIMRSLQSSKLSKSNDSTKKNLNPHERPSFTSITQRGAKDKRRMEDGGNASRGSCGTKRKQRGSESSESQEETVSVSRQVKKKMNREGTGNQWSNKTTAITDETQMTSTVHRPGATSLRSAITSCLTDQPRVVIKRLSLASLRARRPGKGGITTSSFYFTSSSSCSYSSSSSSSYSPSSSSSSSSPRKKQRRKSPVKPRSVRQTELKFTVSDNKENLPEIPSVSTAPSLQPSAPDISAVSGDGDEYVPDSEDEATKNFKGRLFMKRYCKTKHGTFVPTLREFWKPGMTCCSFLSSGGERR